MQEFSNQTGIISQGLIIFRDFIPVPFEISGSNTKEKTVNFQIKSKKTGYSEKENKMKIRSQMQEFSNQTCIKILPKVFCPSSLLKTKRPSPVRRGFSSVTERDGKKIRSVRFFKYLFFRLRLVRFVFLIFISLFSFFSFAFTLPGDNNYLILEEKRFRIIFDKQYLPSIDKISRKIKVSISAMSRFQNRVLDEKLTVILVSSKAQIPNALATIFPSPTISLYSSIIGLTELSLPVYFDGVFEHELNHIFQMSRSKAPEILKKLSIFPGLWFFYIYNPYPNMFLPLFVLEGDSVLKESLFHYGGRLYSGHARALVYSQIQHYRHRPDEFMKKKLFGFSTDTPFRKRKVSARGIFYSSAGGGVFP